MIKNIDLNLDPKEASSESLYRPIVAKMLNIQPEEITQIQLLRRSIDARQRNVKILLQVQVTFQETPKPTKRISFEYPDVSQSKEVVIIGAGPAGLFAALRMIELGWKPVIFERGKSVEERKIDIASIFQKKIINHDSNYCFGEGGAGTYSDGKLYTRSTKRGNVRKILEILHFHGANENILIDAHPHIGTDKLPGIISNIRKSILKAGGQIHFNSRITDFIIKDNSIKAVIDQNNNQTETEAVILACGHSAHDMYELLFTKGITLESKGFAMGIRIEHPQELIDNIQYHSFGARNRYLPPATYNLIHQVAGHGVYSFCMCPGGMIVPASTSNDELVVNGMSNSMRNSEFANSGMVVEIKPENYAGFGKFNELAGLKFQQSIERLAYSNSGMGQIAPAQRMTDFVNKKLSASLPENSYIPGVISSPVHFWLPEFISDRLRVAFKEFDKQKKGFLTQEAMIIGVESRTSSPVRIPRNKETYEHPQIKGLFPCGEGSGYAGGIVSSAIDGENCAEGLARFVTK